MTENISIVVWRQKSGGKLRAEGLVFEGEDAERLAKNYAEAKGAAEESFVYFAANATIVHPETEAESETRLGKF